MNILWFTWKDIKNPRSGGAEQLQDMHAKNLVKRKHKVIILTSSFKNSPKKEIVNGYTVIRRGNRFTVYLAAFFYSFFYLRNWPDIVLEEINTIPFFTHFYFSQKKRFLIVYQLCREIWFFQSIAPFSYLGYVLEWLYLHLLNKESVITISKSTKNDLLNYGFPKENITVIPVGLRSSRIHTTKKYAQFTFLSLGANRPMKQLEDQLNAFNIVARIYPFVNLLVAGNLKSNYGRLIKNDLYFNYGFSNAIQKRIAFLGQVDEQEKQKLLAKSHILLQTAVKEGWGLTVTEAGLFQTPAVTYDNDGLRDSVMKNKTGYVAKKNKPYYLAYEMVRAIDDKYSYRKMQKQAFRFARKFTCQNSTRKFQQLLLKK